MPTRRVCLVTLSLSEAGPGRFGRQHPSQTSTIPYHTDHYALLLDTETGACLHKMVLQATRRAMYFIKLIKSLPPDKLTTR